MGPAVVHVRLAGVWKKIYPLILTGTTDPATTTGAVGDVYFKYRA